MMKRIYQTFFLGILLFFITSSYSAPLQYSHHVAVSRGCVYAMRGLLGTVNSGGMDVIASRAINELKINAQAVGYPQWQHVSQIIITARHAHQLKSPIILIGHSFGADDQINVAWSLYRANIPVDLLVTLDPVSPKRIPPNVKRVVNIFISRPGRENIPMFRGIPVYAMSPSVTQIKNLDLRFNALGFDTTRNDHFNMDDDPNIQNVILAQVRKTMSSYRSGRK